MLIDIEVPKHVSLEEVARAIRELSRNVVIKRMTVDPWSETTLIYFMESLGWKGETISSVPTGAERKQALRIQEWPNPNAADHRITDGA